MHSSGTLAQGMSWMGWAGIVTLLIEGLAGSSDRLGDGEFQWQMCCPNPFPATFLLVFDLNYTTSLVQGDP